MLRIKAYSSTGEAYNIHLAPNAKLSLEMMMPAFDTNLEEGTFSMPITIPWTDDNRRFFGFPEMLNSANTVPNDTWRCDVYDNDIIQLEDAQLRLLSHNGNLYYSNGSYQFNISGSQSRYGLAIKGKKLRDLELGGRITYDTLTYNTRMFATAVMSDPAFSNIKDKIQFAPIRNPEYLNRDREDVGSVVAVFEDTLNYIHTDLSYPLGWSFELPSTAQHDFYRTVPFLNFFYIIRKCFEEFGYKVSGTFFELPSFDKLFLFNNFSIEKYDIVNQLDSTNYINPKDHVPNISIYEFLAAIQLTFCTKMIFNGNEVYINLRENPLQLSTIKTLTSHAGNVYQNAQRNPMYHEGFVVRFEPDSNDTAWSDFVKDTSTITLHASVELYTDLATIASPNDDTFVYVKAENYIYQFQTGTGSWVRYAEGLWEHKEGDGKEVFTLPISPLTESYTVGSFSLGVKDNMCGYRGEGSYKTYNQFPVENPYGLRLFYIIEETTASYTDRPRSAAHNYNADGTKILPISLSITHEDGLYNKRWKQWIEMLKNSTTITIPISLTPTEFSSLKENDILQIQGMNFIIQKLEPDLPIRGDVIATLVKV